MDFFQDGQRLFQHVRLCPLKEAADPGPWFVFKIIDIPPHDVEEKSDAAPAAAAAAGAVLPPPTESLCDSAYEMTSQSEN